MEFVLSGGMRSLAFALSCSDPLFRAAEGAYTSAKHRLVPACATTLVDGAEKAALDLAVYGYERTAVGSFLRKAVSVVKAADAQGSPVGSVEDEGTGLLETAKLNSEGGKPAPVCKELDVWRPENSYVVIDVAIDSLQADDSEPKKAPLKEAGKAVVGSFAAATMASIEESKTRAAAAAKLIKAGISAAKIKAKRTATAAATLGKDYLECAKAAVSLAGTIASAAIKLTGVVMAECWKTILDFGTVAIYWVTRRNKIAPKEEQLAVFRASDLQTGEFALGVAMWLYLASAFAVAWYIVMM